MRHHRSHASEGAPRAAMTALWGTAFLLAGGISACASYSLMVSPRGKRFAPLPKGTPFHITRETPGPEAVPVGTVSFETQASVVEDLLNALRERVRLAGGNLVARLRCGGIGTYVTSGPPALRNAPARLVGANIQCQALVYRVLRAPRRRARGGPQSF